MAEMVWAASKGGAVRHSRLLVVALFGFTASPLALRRGATDLSHRLTFAAMGGVVTAGTELRLLHVLLHLVHYADGAALRRVLPARPGSRRAADRRAAAAAMARAIAIARPLMGR